MKNLKTIILIFAFLINSQFHANSTSQDATVTANSLIKVSYTSPEMQNNVITFINDNALLHRSNTNFIIPSVDEILIKVSELQNFQGCIEDAVVKKQALTALATATRATKNAISITEMQAVQVSDSDYHIPSVHNNMTLKILQSKEALLQQKINELNQKSIWSYFAKPSNAYLMFGAAVILAITGAAYYLHFTHEEPYDHSLYVTAPKQGESQLSAHTREILTDFVDPQNKTNGLTHYNNAKELLEELKNSQEPTINSVDTQKVVEMVETFIEGYEKRDVRIPSMKEMLKDKPSNFKFWYEVYKNKREDYQETISEITDIDPKNINLVNTIYYKLGVNIKP